MNVHGSWCNSKTVPTRCRFCGEPVFFFFCTCGSKVFFQGLGYPWPKHACQQYAEYFQSMVSPVTPLLFEGSRISNLERKYQETLARIDLLQWRNRPITRIDPSDRKKVNDVGTIRGKATEIDVFKRFSIPANSEMGIAILGEMAQNDFLQVTLYVGGLESRQFKSYTFLVRRCKWMSLDGARHDDIVEFELHGKTLNAHPFWLCTTIEWPH